MLGGNVKKRSNTLETYEKNKFNENFSKNEGVKSKNTKSRKYMSTEHQR